MYNARLSLLKLTLVSCFGLFSLTANADLERAKQLIQTGDTNSALTELDKEIALNPNPEAEFLRAVTLQSTGRRQDAIDAYAKMIQSYPELPEPYNNLAVMHAEDKNFDKAVQMLERAILTNKTYATAYENLGDIYSQQASDAYNDALALNPPNKKTVEIKLNLIDNILLPPNLRKPVLNASSNTANTSTAKPISRPPSSTAVTSTTATARPNPTSTAVSTGGTLSATDRTAITTLVNNWAGAWSNQNVPTYLAYYADNFRPVGGGSKATWASSRAEKLQKPSFISIGVTDLNVSPTSRGARATFAQSYQSNTYEDRVMKSLDLIKTPQGWKIQREQSRAL